MDPADLYDDDPGVTSWAGVSDAVAHVAELRAALAAAEARAERAEAELGELGPIVSCARCGRKTPATQSRTPANPELDVCPQCALEVSQEVMADVTVRAQRAEAKIARVTRLGKLWQTSILVPRQECGDDLLDALADQQDGEP